MTNEQINIRIAEACGWTPTPWGGWTMARSGIPSSDCPAFADPPDYLNDLNAMNEAENQLTDEAYHTFLHELWNLRGRSRVDWRITSATSRQRAEAFLRTLGLWEEKEGA